eukprot:TRINITY_DN11597_c0_g2_i1.p1 TRINITY_DN11597_c0_g2~~TRINITY_DN11597_c0_g2_i1.p1  ORF type:complete len:891 (-),score=89.77 TRINITY_DN11597_c0_g2_i1:80-2752(-)
MANCRADTKAVHQTSSWKLIGVRSIGRCMFTVFVGLATIAPTAEGQMLRFEDRSETGRRMARSYNAHSKVTVLSDQDTIRGSMDMEVLDVPIFSSDPRMKQAIDSAILEVSNQSTAIVNCTIIVNQDSDALKVVKRADKANDNETTNGSSALNFQRNLTLGRAVVEFTISEEGIMDRFGEILNLMRQAAFVDVIGLKYRGLTTGHLGYGGSAEFTPRACHIRKMILQTLSGESIKWTPPKKAPMLVVSMKVGGLSLEMMAKKSVLRVDAMNRVREVVAHAAGPLIQVGLTRVKVVPFGNPADGVCVMEADVAPPFNVLATDITLALTESIERGDMSKRIEDALNANHSNNSDSDFRMHTVNVTEVGSPETVPGPVWSEMDGLWNMEAAQSSCKAPDATKFLGTHKHLSSCKKAMREDLDCGYTIISDGDNCSCVRYGRACGMAPGRATEHIFTYLLALLNVNGSLFDDDSSLLDFPLRTRAPTKAPSAAPTEEEPMWTFSPTAEITAEPSQDPTPNPSVSPTAKPSAAPSAEPTEEPTSEPTMDPSATPTMEPSAEPSSVPTLAPTPEPTIATSEPTEEPTGVPTSPAPTPGATPKPSDSPTGAPTDEPTMEPTWTFQPSSDPSASPTAAPSDSPSMDPTTAPTDPPPTAQPSLEPSAEPTSEPTTEPTTLEPTPMPSPMPTESPTPEPTLPPSQPPATPRPSFSPTHAPSDAPSSEPTSLQTDDPTPAPSPSPTAGPTNAPVHALNWTFRMLGVNRSNMTETDFAGLKLYVEKHLSGMVGLNIDACNASFRPAGNRGMWVTVLITLPHDPADREKKREDLLGKKGKLLVLRIMSHVSYWTHATNGAIVMRNLTANHTKIWEPESFFPAEEHQQHDSDGMAADHDLLPTG